MIESHSLEERMEEQGVLPWTEGDGKWVVTYLSCSGPGDGNGVCDATFDFYEDAYKFALSLLK